MLIAFDPAKDQANRTKHGLSLAFAAEVLADPCLIEIADERQDYGEPRIIAFGAVAGLVYVTVYTPRRDGRRIISVRRANRRERRFYSDTQTQV